MSVQAETLSVQTEILSVQAETLSVQTEILSVQPNIECAIRHATIIKYSCTPNNNYDTKTAS
jgi:cell division protein FtsL